MFGAAGAREIAEPLRKDGEEPEHLRSRGTTEVLRRRVAFRFPANTSTSHMCTQSTERRAANTYPSPSLPNPLQLVHELEDLAAHIGWDERLGSDLAAVEPHDVGGRQRHRLLPDSDGPREIHQFASLVVEWCVRRAPAGGVTAAEADRFGHGSRQRSALRCRRRGGDNPAGSSTTNARPARRRRGSPLRGARSGPDRPSRNPRYLMFANTEGERPSRRAATVTTSRRAECAHATSAPSRPPGGRSVRTRKHRG